MIDNKLKIFSFVALLLLLVGCSEQDATQNKENTAKEHVSSCHSSGAVISEFPGAKGELYSRTIDRINKFCSTRDLFLFMLQPENRHLIKEVYVHDMSKALWDTPNDDDFTNARTAWFVISSSQKDPIEKTLGSFSDKADAEVFINEFGGELYAFNEITIDLF
jgi:copper chaperone NosL